MRIFFFLVLMAVFTLECNTKSSEVEICFENLRRRIKPDSILEKLKLSPIESYGNYASIIDKAIKDEAKNSFECSKAINNFLSSNKENSITVNNLILFQEFQAYLRCEKFDKIKAKNAALKYISKWK